MEPPETAVLETTIRYGCREAWAHFSERVPDPDAQGPEVQRVIDKLAAQMEGECTDVVALALFTALAELCDQCVSKQPEQ